MAFRWIAVSLGARVTASLCGLALALIVAPEDFGVYGRVVLGVLASGTLIFLRLERVVIGSPDPAVARAASDASIRIMVLTLPICLGLVWLAVPDLGRAKGAWLTAAALVASLAAKSLLLLAFAWLQRKALGVRLAIAMTAQAIVQLTVQAALLASPLPPVTAMLAGDSIGALAGLAVALRALRGVDMLSGIGGWRAALRENWRLPTLNMPATFASLAVTMLPLFAVGAYAPAVETGAIAFAQRIFEPAFHLCAALATQFAIERKLFRPGLLAPRQRLAHAGGYLALGFVVASLLVLITLAAQALPIPPKLAAALSYMQPVIALSLAVYAGGPVMDLAQLAGREVLVLVVNAGVLAFGLAILLTGGGAIAILWAFAALLWLRAAIMLALWITARA
jgi:hypothetical protein